jgi:hypothetical protein
MGEGGPTYAARTLPQYISAFATRVLQSTYVYVEGERARIFKLLRTPGIAAFLHENHADKNNSIVSQF